MPSIPSDPDGPLTKAEAERLWVMAQGLCASGSRLAKVGLQIHQILRSRYRDPGAMFRLDEPAVFCEAAGIYEQTLQHLIDSGEIVPETVHGQQLISSDHAHRLRKEKRG